MNAYHTERQFRHTMSADELLSLDIQHYRRLLAEGKLSLAAQVAVHKLLAKAEAELAALRPRSRMQ